MSQPISGRTRYHCNGNPPPDIAAICRQLDKYATRRGAFKNQGHVRGIALKASREYARRGPADDLVRFLFNHGVLLPNGTKEETYYDSDRAAIVIKACEERTIPPDPAPREERLAALCVRPAAVPPSFEDEDDNEEIIPESTDEAGDSFAEIADDPDEAHEEIPEEPPLPVPSAFRFVLYLTPVEFDVWENFDLLRQDIDGQIRVPIPKDDQRLAAWRSRGVECPMKEYRRAVERFIDAGIVEPVGSSGGGNDAYRFTMPPEKFLAVKIARRSALFLTPEDIAFIRGHLDMYARQDAKLPTKEEIVQHLDEHFVKPIDLQTGLNREFLKLYYFGAGEYADGDWLLNGFFREIPESHVFLPSHRKFEPIALFRFEGRPELVAHVIRVPSRNGSSAYLFAEARGDVGTWHESYVYSRDGVLQDEFTDTDLIQPLTDPDLAERLTLLHWMRDEVPKAIARVSQVTVAREKEREDRRRRLECIEAKKRALEDAKRQESEAHRQREALEAELKRLEGK